MPDLLWLAVYSALCALLACYGVHRVALLLGVGGRAGWERACARAAVPGGPLGDQASIARAAPSITVQIPLYNESAVARRVILACADLDWPRDAFEIQVLDDSTDATRVIVDQAVAEVADRGLAIRVLRRTQRSGYKAGALESGLASARGGFVAIFDADFVPERDFLRRVAPQFDDPGVGMVQTRWGHANRDQSLLTRAAATLLDGHFVIEHTGRAARDLYINFNGTAGVWRRAAIDGGGGWEHDTLTEDLDLSYRAQLAGWRFVYLPGVAAPAELPADIASFRSQQARWARGSVQVARKLLPRVLRARVRPAIKLEALAHLLGNAALPLVVAMGLVLPFAQGAARSMGSVGAAIQGAAFLLASLTVFVFLERSQAWIGRPWGRRLIDVALALALSVGISVSQSAAVARGFARRTGEFARTPKRGAARVALYRSATWHLAGIEIALAAWIACGAAFQLVEAGGASWVALLSLPSTAVFVAGFAWVGALGLAERWRRRLPAVDLGAELEAGPGAARAPATGAPARARATS